MRWHYDTLAEFNRQWYDGVLTQSDLLDEELFISEYKDTYGNPTIADRFFFVLKSGKIKYLLDSDLVDKLPIIVKSYEKVSYKGKGYRLITSAKSVKFKAEKRMSFRELLNTFAEFRHSEPSEFLKWKLIVIVSWLNRINVRVATEPAFGKDSVVNVLSYLMGNVAKVANPTIAKLEYLLFNKVLMINEVSGIKAEDRHYIEQFILSAGDFSNTYEKRSRASGGSVERYDISNLSLLLTYNTLNNYKTEDKYFDYMFQNNDAVISRVIPFKFSGVLEERFDKVFNVKEELEKSNSYFENFIRTMMYYKDITNVYNELHKYKLHDNIKQAVDNIKHQRWKQTFNRLMLYADLYSESELEFNQLVAGLINSHWAYDRMLNGGNFTLNNIQQADIIVTEEKFDDEGDKELQLAYKKLKELYDLKKDWIPLDEFLEVAMIPDYKIQTLVRLNMAQVNEGYIIPL